MNRENLEHLIRAAATMPDIGVLRQRHDLVLR